MPSFLFQLSRTSAIPLALGLAGALTAQDGPAQPVAPESFEALSAGGVEVARLTCGLLRAAVGHVRVTDKYARTGRQSLHLVGGEDRELEILDLPTDDSLYLTFWAERWTKNKPFDFRIYARGDNQEWAEVYAGSRTLRVGARFLSRVRLELPLGTRAIRMRARTPPSAGVLIDDLLVAKPSPMRVERADHSAWIAPAMIGDWSPITRVEVETAGFQAPLQITACTVRLASPALSSLAGLRIGLSGDADGRSLTQAWPVRIAADKQQLRVPCQLALREGTQSLWVEARLDSTATWTTRVGASVTEFELSNGRKWTPTGTGRQQRPAVAVRRRGDDNCHTFRIPGLVTTNAGTLLAVYDCRYRSSGDLPGDIDVGLRRSTDGGRTWEPQRIVLDLGRDPKWNYDGVGDPAILVDRRNGTIWVIATWSHGNRSWHGSGPGTAPEETGQLMLSRSDDDGQTWSPPINITEQVKDPRWRFVLQGPGAGITMRDGTLVFAAQFRSSNAKPTLGKPFSTLIYSKDHGKTWHIGTGPRIDTTEAQVVELPTGELMLNCRDNRGGSRAVLITGDLGKTWREHSSSRGALIEPVCMASLLRVDRDGEDPLLVFSNPATTSSRSNMTLKVSKDLGKTWPESLHTLHDQRSCYGYSCLTQIDTDTIGLLYEGRGSLYFARFALSELLDP